MSRLKATHDARRQRTRCGAAMFVAVTATAMIVSVLALAALTVVRIERRQATSINNRLIARTHARSAVELALQKIGNNSTWRTDHANGVETTRLLLGSSATGTVSWILRDEDGSLTNADSKLWLKGIGRVGDTVQVSSVRLSPDEIFNNNFRSNAASDGLILGIGADGAADDLDADDWWGQYFKPNLPAGAIYWRISRVDIVASRRNSSRQFSVRLYQAAANGLPIGAAIDSVSVNSSSVSSSTQTYGVNFSGAAWLSAGAGACVTLETSESQPPIRVSYDTSVSVSNSALIRGEPTWNSVDADDALEYRIYGFYRTSEEVHPLAGTWEWDSPLGN
jgi:Tfp pilus assembly protein PilX